MSVRPRGRRVAAILPFAVALVAASSTFMACGAGRREEIISDAGPQAGEAGIGFNKDGAANCQGLACKVEKCEGKPKTTLTGKVFDPAGEVPLYNVAVYIPGGLDPDADLPPIKSSLEEGVTCDRCAAGALKPLVSAITDTEGAFTLEDVPVGEEIPVVIQIGKWRRRIKVAIPDACEENTVKSGTLRLPKNGSEGDMPHIAVTAGGYDALECLLQGIGIDESEFVAGDDPSGHVHVFKGSGGFGLPNAPSADTELWNDAEKLKKFDITMLSCEGTPTVANKGDSAPGARQSMVDYANAGGRVFATHFHYVWFQNSPDDSWKTVANWGSSAGGAGTYDVDTSFPKGQALADWLVAINASSTVGKVKLDDATGSLTSVNAPSQSWIMKDTNAVKYFSFNAPIGADDTNVCGRAVFSDVHMMGGGYKEFPNDCPGSGNLTAQQKAVEFMFFDLSACVQADDTPPAPPQ